MLTQSRSIVGDREDNKTNKRMYKSFEELCLRVKSLFTWKLEQLNNSMPIKSLSDSFLLPELELIINDRGSLSRCLDAYYQKTMNFIQTALRL